MVALKRDGSRTQSVVISTPSGGGATAKNMGRLGSNPRPFVPTVKLNPRQVQDMRPLPGTARPKPRFPGTSTDSKNRRSLAAPAAPRQSADRTDRDLIPARGGRSGGVGRAKRK